VSRLLRSLVVWSAVLLVCAAASFAAQGEDSLPDYTKPARPFPLIFKPYLPWHVPPPDLANSNAVSLAVEQGKLQLSMARLIAAVVDNNLTIAAARRNVSIAQTELMRARSGASPRGVDAAQIPSEVFAGAQGGSILGTAAGGGGGGASNAGGITGAATQVIIRPVGVFDPTLSLNFSVDHTNSPLNTVVVAGVPAVTSGTAAFSVNYTQAFSTGTSFTLNYGMQRQGSTQLHLLFDPTFTPGFNFTVNQQMLNGFGFAVNRALIKVAENERQIERESFRRQVITTLSTAENAYWDLVAAQAAVRAAEQALTAAQQLEADNKKQAGIGTMASLDVVTAESQTASSRRDLIVAQTNLTNVELQLKGQFTKSFDDAFASAAIETSDMFPDPDNTPLPSLQQAIEIANRNRPDVSVAEGNIKSQKDVLPFIRNALAPNLNIYGLVSTVGLYNYFGTSFTEAIHFKYPQVAFGIQLTFPFHNRQAQADEVRSQLELRQSQDTLVRTKSQVEVDVQNALIALAQSKAQVAAAREAVRLEQQKLSDEQTKLASGLSTSYDVVLVQRDLFAAQLAQVQANAAYAKAHVTLDQAMGTTLERNHITLDDALQGRLPS
jgi:outer membrane protein